MPARSLGVVPLDVTDALLDEFRRLAHRHQRGFMVEDVMGTCGSPSCTGTCRPGARSGWRLSAMLFFGSVLVHELAHALVSQARGIRVQDITLFLFGGATRARVESRGPGDEFLIALVGPLTSGILAGLFGIIAGLGRDVLSTPLAGTLGYLAWTNLLLAAFNLVPGFPLDGGRLLRSAIWKATGSLGRATRVASVAGRGVGWLLVASGVAWLLAGDLAGRLVHQFHGQLVKTTGDGILATFDGPGRAIRCVAALGAELGGIGLQIRAGLHTGEIELRDGDVGGIAVHIAARVMAAAGPGQILTTRTVRDLVVGSDIAMDDLGTRPLKGVQGVWQLFAARP